MAVHPDLSVDEIERLLAGAAARPVEVGDGSGRVLAHTHLQHALQTAALLAAAHPDDAELAVAGLVHDLGHLLPGAVDETHAEVGAAAVRAALGERVAGLVGLHVAAKRYLAAEGGGYGRVLSADSTSSMMRQGGPMSAGSGRRSNVCRWRPMPCGCAGPTMRGRSRVLWSTNWGPGHRCCGWCQDASSDVWLLSRFADRADRSGG